MTLTAAGPTVTEVAPGIDLRKDVVALAGFPFQVAPDVRTMDARLFTPQPMGLALRPRAPRAGH